MNSQIVVAAIQGGSQLLTKVLDKRPAKVPPMQAESPDAALRRIYGPSKDSPAIQSTPSQVIVTEITDDVEEKPEIAPVEQRGTACIPCGLSHVATCAGELNEAVRFAREDITSEEVVTRINHCISEIAACERIDLAPENIVGLEGKEKELADVMATEIRDIRHGLEWFKNKEDIEELAAKTTALQQKIGREWLKMRINALTPKEKAQVKAKVQERFGEEMGGLLEDGQS